MTAPFAIIESPYAGDIERNLRYLHRANRTLISKGFTPYASHGYFPYFLDDNLPVARNLGIEMGLEISLALVLSDRKRSRVFFFTDYGISPGMTEAIKFWERENIQRTYYSIGTNDKPVGDF